MAKHQDAEILDAGKELKTSIAWREGSCKGTIRLSPSVSCCGGMFVAKLKKNKGNIQKTGYSEKEDMKWNGKLDIK